MSKGKKEFYITMAGGKQLKMTVPTEAKVTFGPAFRDSKSKEYSGDREYALRVYEGATEKTPLLLCLTGVRSVRNTDVEFLELVISESGKKLWKTDKGGYKVEEAVKRDEKWIDTKALNAKPTGEDEF